MFQSGAIKKKGEEERNAMQDKIKPVDTKCPIFLSQPSVRNVFCLLLVCSHIFSSEVSNILCQAVKLLKKDLPIHRFWIFFNEEEELDVLSYFVVGKKGTKLI